MHDQRNAILPTLPVAERLAFGVCAEPLRRKVVGDTPCSLGGFGEGAAPLTADRHDAVPDDIGHRVQDRADRPFTHPDT